MQGTLVQERKSVRVVGNKTVPPFLREYYGSTLGIHDKIKPFLKRGEFIPSMIQAHAPLRLVKKSLYVGVLGQLSKTTVQRHSKPNQQQECRRLRFITNPNLNLCFLKVLVA